ncbi:sterol desaturase family protein [Roseivirga pacifica]|uniref:sterol desaturase family protein n=1 Tax=Roseivirga pacifica TaxID=1267423 RepID=UPI003BB17484
MLERAIEFLKTILNQGNLAINLGIVIICLASELIVIGWKKSSFKAIFRKDKSVKTDLIMTALAVFNLTNLISLILSFGLFQVVSKLIFDNTNLQLALKIDNLYLQFFILYLISNFSNYVGHWMMHNVKPLWRLHEFHHSASSFSVMTRYRLHFVEIAVGKLINAIPYAVFGAPLLTFFIITWIEEFHQLFIHSRVKANFGWLGRNLFISPDTHKLHHSVSKHHYGRNYGVTLVIWDRIFGAFKSPVNETLDLGIPDNPYNKNGFLGDVWYSMKKAYASLMRKN